MVSNNEGAGFCVYGGGTGGKPHSGDPTTPPTSSTGTTCSNAAAMANAAASADYHFVSGRTGNVWSGNTWDNGATVPPEKTYHPAGPGSPGC